MKKIIVFIAIALLVLIIVASVGLVIFLKTFDFNNLKPYIISASRNSLGRAVGFADIKVKVSLKNGVQLSLADLTLGEHPDFGHSDFLVAKQVNLGVSILDLVLKRQVRVLNIEVDSPAINIIRIKDGRLNVQSLSTANQPPGSQSQIAPMAIPAILINRVDIKSARIKYVDQMIEPLLSIDIQQIEVNIHGLSLTAPFPIKASLALFSSSPNVFFEGMGEVSLKDLAFLLKDSTLSFDAGSLSEEELRRSIPQLQQVPEFNIDSGKLTSAIKLIEIGQDGLVVKLDAGLQNGKVSMPQLAPGVSLMLQGIAANIKNFSLSDEFSFSIEGAYLSQNPNIKAKGKAVLSLDDQTCEITELEANADLSSFSLNQLASSVEALKNIPLPQAIKGKLKVTADQLIVGSAGLAALRAQASLAEGSIRMKELAVPIDAIEATCDIDESAITLNQSSFYLGKGKVQSSGTILDYLNKQEFAFTAKADGIDIAECLDQKANPIKIQGLVSGNFEVTGQGFNPETLVPSLGGDSTIEIKESKLTDINILKLVLDKLSFVPNLAQALEANLPERFKEKLKNKDTIITGLTITSSIKQGSILIQPINMEADGFIFRGNGSVGLDQSYALDGKFIIPQDLAAKILESVPEMGMLLNAEKQIVFPLKVAGKGAAVSFHPDIKSLGTTAIKNKAQEELGKVLNKVFDKNKEQSPQEGSGQTQPQENPGQTGDSASEPVQQEKDSKQQLIESIANIIFGQ